MKTKEKKDETKRSRSALTNKSAPLSTSSRDPIQSNYRSGEIPLGEAVYTAGEVDALLLGKADTSHNHSAANITSGTLAAARGGTGADGSSISPHYVLAGPSSGSFGAISFRALVSSDLPSHSHSTSDITGLGDAATKNVGTTSGTVAAGNHDHTGVYQPAGSYATLVNGLIPSNQLPSYVDDVLEYDGTNHFPTTGEAGKIYVDTDTDKTYRWSGTQYVEISASDVSLTSASGGYYPYQLTVGSASCNIDFVSLDSSIRTISVNGGTPVSLGDSVSVSGSGPYQLYVNNNLQCYIPAASVNTASNSVTVDGSTLYVPSISISGQTITYNGMSYNMYPISWDSTTRSLSLDTMTSLYVSDLDWDSTYYRLYHHGDSSTTLIGWSQRQKAGGSDYIDELFVGGNSIYLDGNSLHIGTSSISILPSGWTLASDIYMDYTHTTTVADKLSELIGSTWSALRLGSNGNVLDYSGSAIAKGSLKLNGSTIATLDDLPTVNDASLEFYVNGIKLNNEFSANSSSSTSFGVETYAYATCDTTSYTTLNGYRIYTFALSPYVNGPSMDVKAGSMLLVKFINGGLNSTVNDGNIKFAVQTGTSTTNRSPMLPNANASGPAWSVVEDQEVLLTYDGYNWVMLNGLPAIDSTPTNGSSNLVTSNGVYQAIGQYALSNGAGISITNALISVNGTDGHGTTFHNPGENSPLYIDVNDGSTSQAGIVQLENIPQDITNKAATPQAVNTVAKDVAPNWVQSRSYAEGAYVTKDGVLYKAKNSISANTAWSASNWEATSIADDLVNMASKADVTLTDAWEIVKTPANASFDGLEYTPIDSSGIYYWSATIDNHPCVVSSINAQDEDATHLEFTFNGITVICTKLDGYQLGEQSDKPLAKAIHTHNSICSPDGTVTLAAQNNGTATITIPGAPISDGSNLETLATTLGLSSTATLDDVRQALGLSETATLADAMSAAAIPVSKTVATVDQIPDFTGLQTILSGMPANLDTYDNALQAINVLWNAVYKLAYGTDRT